MFFPSAAFLLAFLLKCVGMISGRFSQKILGSCWWCRLPGGWHQVTFQEFDLGLLFTSIFWGVISRDQRSYQAFSSVTILLDFGYLLHYELPTREISDRSRRNGDSTKNRHSFKLKFQSINGNGTGFTIKNQPFLDRQVDTDILLILWDMVFFWLFIQYLKGKIWAILG